MTSETVNTPVLKLLGIKYPIILAGMNKVAGPKLCAAVTNAGGLGVFGGASYTPRLLRKNIQILKKNLAQPGLPFGVDLLLPKVGGGARATNYDYTKGKLDKLLDIIIDEGASLFVSAVGVPPKHVVEKLHKAGIPIMNMVGAPKHVTYALNAGVDLICAQGGEGGGHTGEVATSILIPKVVDMCKNKKSPLTGGPIHVVAAGGIFDGRGMAMALSLGAEAVWVGTRFVCATEAGAPKDHVKAVLGATVHDTVRTIVYTGRPMRILKNEYTVEWESKRKSEMLKVAAKGIIPVKHDSKLFKEGKTVTATFKRKDIWPWLMGQCAGVINDVKPAKQILEEMMAECVAILKHNISLIQPVSKM